MTNLPINSVLMEFNPVTWLGTLGNSLWLYGMGAIFLFLLIIVVIFDGIFDFDGVVGPAVVFSFLSILGFVGGACYSKGLPLWVALLLGAVAGLLAALSFAMVTKYLKNSEGAQISEQTLVGGTGMVVLTIPENGWGEVKVNNMGHIMNVGARSKRGKLTIGTKVRIVDTLSSGAVMVESEEALVPPTRDSIADDVEGGSVKLNKNFEV